MRSADEVLITDGTGYWSKKVKEVRITGLVLDTDTWKMFREESPEDLPYGELEVHFDPKTWDNFNDGMIYTDPHWLADLKDYLTRAGYNVEGIGYSEAGMQGDGYVSLDVGHVFINSWEKLFA